MKKLMIFTAMLFFAFNLVKAEEVPGPETQASVKELYEFHEVIATIWHDAWPDKNISLLKELLPEVEKGVTNVKNAQLPGILRDKQEKWDEGVKQLVAYYEEYKSAAEGTDDQALLDAAENLHMQFERLVRTIRPVMKEIDAFHVELYKLYHYYLPEYDYEKIKESVEILKAKLLPLLKAETPKRIQDKEKEFNDAKVELNKSVHELAKVVNDGDDKDAIKEAIEVMHTNYQILEHVFD